MIVHRREWASANLCAKAMQRYDVGVEDLVCLFLTNRINLGTQRLIHLEKKIYAQEQESGP